MPPPRWAETDEMQTIDPDFCSRIAGRCCACRPWAWRTTAGPRVFCGGSCSASADSADYGLPEACCRDWLKQQLQDAGVTTIIYYPIPIHRQPAYADLGYGPGSLPITERLCAEVLSLPIFPELSEAQQQRVIEVVSQLAQQPTTALAA